MNSIIETINNKLKAIIAELEQNKNESMEALASVQTKIDDKIEEAKKYKIDVDNAKDSIKVLELEIKSLEEDLNDLNERFGKKDLNAILEAGNKEINTKMIDKQKEITKYREKIGELTERARTIKDLLINLKKDKETKENRVECLTKALNYYKKSLTNISDYALEHVNDLDSYEYAYKSSDYKPYHSAPVDDSPVFDEIESIAEEPEETEDAVSLFDHDKTQKIDFKTLNDTIDKEYADIFGDSGDISIPPSPKEEPKDVFEQNDLQEETPAEPVQNEPVETKEEVLDSIDDNIFDQKEELNEVRTEPIIPDMDDKTGLTETDIFGNDYKPEPTDNKEDDTELVNFFTPLGIDYYSFSPKSEKYLKGMNKEMATKVLDVLKRNNIDIKYVYDAPKIFVESTPAELEHVISKLLLAGQTTQNIGYVLDTLPQINSFDLNEVIESYGPLIKDANITDLIIKAKHLNDIGGGAK